MKSEDQGEELLSSCIVGRKLVVGGEKGVLRLWEVGVWDDNEETVAVGTGASADVLACVPDGVGSENLMAVGMDDGCVRFVEMGGKRARVAGEVRHDEVEGVGGLGFEVGGRMISGGGQVVKVWEESGERDQEDDGKVVAPVNGKRGNVVDSDEDESEDGESDNSSEEDKPKRKKKKRRRNKGNDRGGGQHVIGFKGMD